MIFLRITVPFIFFTCCSYALMAQDYIVTSQNDTLYGDIIVNNLNNQAIDRLTLKTETGKKNYTAVQAIRFHKDGADFHTLKYQERYVYMKLDKEGYVSLYYARPEGHYDYSIPIFHKSGGDMIEVPTIGFKKTLLDFMGDCPQVKQKLESGEYKRRNMEKMLEAYNACIGQKTANIMESISTQNHNTLGQSEIIEKHTTATVVETDSVQQASAPENTIMSDSLQTVFNQFEEMVNASTLENKNDVLEMAREVTKRHQQGESIPNFLSNVLLSAVKSSEELTAQARTLIYFKK